MAFSIGMRCGVRLDFHEFKAYALPPQYRLNIFSSLFS